MRKDTTVQTGRSVVSARRFTRVSAAAVLALALLAAVGCEAVFTYSPFSALRRDPDSLSDEQKTAYAAQALESSDLKAINDAYKMVTKMLEKADDDAKKELLPLAIELALKDSGATGIVFDALSSAGDTDPDAALDMLDKAVEELKGSSANFTDAAKNILDLENLSSGAVTVEQCVLTAVGLLLTDPGITAVLEDPSHEVDPDSKNITDANTLIELANEIQESGGGSSGEITALLSMFGGLGNLPFPGGEL